MELFKSKRKRMSDRHEGGKETQARTGRKEVG